MGNKQPHKAAPKLRRSELEEFSKQSLLLPTVIEGLYSHFYRISQSRTPDGVIDISEFCFSIKKQESSLLIERIFHMFDTNSDKVINFREFILGISILSENQDLMIRENSTMAAIRMKEKIEQSLRIFDLRQCKKVYSKDLLDILTTVIQEKAFKGLSRKMIKKIVRNTFKSEETQEDEIGKYWTQETYAKMVMKYPAMFKWISVDIETIKHQIKQARNVAKCLSL
jgi:Ca2+-binding EF-hand superfamily protein